MMVGGRRLGSIRFGELAALKPDLIGSAARGILLHVQEIRDALIADQIERHCVVPNMLTEVNSVVDAETMQQIVRNAKATFRYGP